MSDKVAADAEDISLKTIDPCFNIDTMNASLGNDYEELNMANPEIAKGVLDNATN